MAFPKSLKELCNPALFYFVISIVGLLMVAFQNMGNNRELMIGSTMLNLENSPVIFIVKLLYILFWTWILNLICKDGHSGISWLLVFLPFILIVLLVLALMLE
jgi:hypothetical protein